MNLPTILIATLSLSFLTLLTSLSHASENTVDAKPLQKWYKVEVIIFTQRDVFGDELASRNVVMNYPQNLIDLDNNAAGFNALPNNQRELGPDVYSLNRTGVYKVLFHKIWRQPGLTPAAAPWINIDIAGENTAINGSLRVYLSSYLHMESNIWQVSYATTAGSTTPQPLGNTALTAQDSLQGPSDTNLLQPAPWPQPPMSPIALSKITTEGQRASMALNLAQTNINGIILLKQASRLKLNKLHYFDHPKMGLLFKVTRSKGPIIKNLPKPETNASKSTEQKNTNDPVFGTNPALY